MKLLAEIIKRKLHHYGSSATTDPTNVNVMDTSSGAAAEQTPTCQYLNNLMPDIIS